MVWRDAFTRRRLVHESEIRAEGDWISEAIDALCPECGASWYCEHKPRPTCESCPITIGLSVEYLLSQCYAPYCPLKQPENIQVEYYDPS